MKAENKEAEILKAAEAEFLEKGYEGAKTTAIAERAGVTHAMLHYYFRTKENLFNRIFEDKLKLVSETIGASLLSTDKDFFGRIEDTINAHYKLLQQNRSLPRFIINEAATNPTRIDALRAKIYTAIYENIGQNLQSDLDRLVAEKKIRPVTIQELLLDILSLNIFCFIFSPVLNGIFFTEETAEAFYEARRKETIRTIMCRLKYDEQ